MTRLWHRLASWPSSLLVAGTLAAVSISVALFLLMSAGVCERSPVGRALCEEQAGRFGIIRLQLAFTNDKAASILDAWGPEGVRAIRQALVADYGFMAAYAPALAGLTVLLARSLKPAPGTAAALALTPLLAALFDGLENAIHLRSVVVLPLQLPPSGPAVFLASFMALIKWALVLVSVGFLAGGLAIAMARRWRFGRA